MKRSTQLIYSLLLIALLAGCVPVTAPAASTTLDTVQSTGAMTATTSSVAAAFPVTIEHKFGSTEIKSLPKRIVTVGLTDHDALLALGVVPVGTTEWFGKYPSAVWPWAQDKLEGAKPEVVGDGSTTNFEKIAALKPDVILALYSGVTQEQYDLLKKIAPTVAQPTDYVDYGIPWQALTHTVGQVVGQTQQADALIADVEARFAKVKADHPEFTKTTALVVTPYQGIWVYGLDDARSRFLTEIGFQLPGDLGTVTGKEFGANISLERADLLNVGALVWLSAKPNEGPLAEPVYQKLTVHIEGREIFLDGDDAQGGAFSFVSVLSLPYLIDQLTPIFAAAVDGDPKTVVGTLAKP